MLAVLQGDSTGGDMEAEEPQDVTCSVRRLTPTTSLGKWLRSEDEVRFRLVFLEDFGGRKVEVSLG